MSPPKVHLRGPLDPDIELYALAVNLPPDTYCLPEELTDEFEEKCLAHWHLHTKHVFAIELHREAIKLAGIYQAQAASFLEELDTLASRLREDAAELNRSLPALTPGPPRICVGQAVTTKPSSGSPVIGTVGTDITSCTIPGPSVNRIFTPSPSLAPQSCLPISAPRGSQAVRV